MKKYCLRVLAAVGLAVAIMPAHAVMISLNPSVTTAMPGDSVSLDLVVSDLGDGTAPSVGDFDIDFSFDDSALSFLSYSAGLGLGDVGLGHAFDFSGGDLGGGMVNLLIVSFLENDAGTCIFCSGPFLEDIQGDTVVLATLNFMVDVLQEGSSTVVAFDTVFAFGDGFGNALSIAGTNDALIINPSTGVPEPGVITLIAFGAFLLFARQRYFKQR